MQFDFLGYTFKPRSIKSKNGEFFTGYNPSISSKAKKGIGNTMREWLPKQRIHLKLEEIVKMINPVIQGWINLLSPTIVTIISPSSLHHPHHWREYAA